MFPLGLFAGEWTLMLTSNTIATFVSTLDQDGVGGDAESAKDDTDSVENPLAAEEAPAISGQNEQSPMQRSRTVSKLFRVKKGSAQPSSTMNENGATNNSAVNPLQLEIQVQGGGTQTHGEVNQKATL
jgi:hypothetical protein